MIMAAKSISTSPSQKLLDEQLIPLTEVSDILPRKADGRRISRCTLWRWASKGRSVGGLRVRLETTTIGKTRYTSREALARFGDQLTRSPEDSISAGMLPRTAARRRKDHNAATEQLIATGFMEPVTQ